MTFGGYDESQLLPYPSVNDRRFYNYDNRHNREWGTELRRIYLSNSSHNISIDSG
jgi:hypothetical protein